MSFSLCSKMKTQRIRDPIHEMIVFDHTVPLDMAVWRLLNTPEVQRLRRVKQLGVSDFVYPSATHSRFAHSVGVFQNARRLVKLIAREVELGRVPGQFNDHRAKVSVLAALLHDIGHGPFSHAFEEARKAIAERRGTDKKIRKHEAFTAEMIRNKNSSIGSILSEVGVHANEVAELVEAETPEDMYHAIVSSSFDADRLDYVERDRYMTGVGAGAIDCEWLMDNVRVAEIDVSPAGDDGTDAAYRHSFCLLYKAREAAEDFLLARYRLYTNVYLHKTTRGFEQLIAALLRSIAESVESGHLLDGLDPDHPLAKFFSKDGETLENYKALDDVVVWGAIHRFAVSARGISQEIAQRLLERRRPYCLDVQLSFPQEPELQRRLKHRLGEEFKAELNSHVFRDTAKLSLYGEIGGDDSRAQKRLMIQPPDRKLKEITDFSDRAIAQTSNERPFERYYFLRESDYKRAEAAVQTIRGHR
jgi:HD superfamily phosphohydrolase